MSVQGGHVEVPGWWLPQQPAALEARIHPELEVALPHGPGHWGSSRTQSGASS